LAAVRDHPQLHVIADSVTNETRLAERVDAADEVYHLAAVVGVRRVLDEPEQTVATNVGPTEALLRHLADRPRPLFFASTSAAYGKTPRVPLAEDAARVRGPPPRAGWIYACTKPLDESPAPAYPRRHGLPVVVGRFFNVVGPRQLGR